MSGAIVGAERSHAYSTWVDLTIKECPSCGIVYGIPQDFNDKRFNDGGNWFCPNGHSLVFKQTESQKQARKAEAAERRATNAENAARYQRERAGAEQRRASAYKGQATRIRNRIAAGVCPVPGCRRSGFTQIMRHIEAKHPSWVAEHQHEISTGE